MNDIQSQGIARRPTPKKKLNRKSMTVATIPEAWLPSHTVPAKIAMQQHWPAAAKSINLRRPSLSALEIIIRRNKRALPINGPDGDKRRDEISDSVKPGHQQSQVMGHADGFLEDHGVVLIISDEALWYLWNI
jgi:hypothetical protein